ncbi:MAG: hypothetical protein ABJP48_00195 [Erythrobacter sp.]
MRLCNLGTVMDGRKPLINSRKTPRQGTSAVAYTGDRPAPEDPILNFTPVPHSRPRSNSITADLQREFIAHLAATGIVSQAARHIGKSLEAIYKLRQRPGAEEFREAWSAALDQGVSRLEDGALARAINGEERLVIAAGQVLGSEIRHNEQLVMFFLRNRLSARYGASGANGELAPGNPIYERLREEIRTEFEEETRKLARSPERMEEIEQWLLGFKERWRKEWEQELAEAEKQ